jgi:hypothetical protein
VAFRTRLFVKCNKGLWPGRFFINRDQTRKVQAARSGHASYDEDQNCLSAGLFQIVRPIINHFAGIAIELAHLALFGAIEALHRRIVIQAIIASADPINGSGSEDANGQNNAAGPFEAGAQLSRLAGFDFGHVLRLAEGVGMARAGNEMAMESKSGAHLSFLQFLPVQQSQRD